MSVTSRVGSLKVANDDVAHDGEVEGFMLDKVDVVEGDAYCDGIAVVVVACSG